MKITRRREIITERTRRITVKFGDESSRGFCASCERLERFVAAREAALIGGITEREIFKMIEAGKLHFQETEQGEAFVCLASVTADNTE